MSLKNRIKACRVCQLSSLDVELGRVCRWGDSCGEICDQSRLGRPANGDQVTPPRNFYVNLPAPDTSPIHFTKNQNAFLQPDRIAPPPLRYLVFDSRVACHRRSTSARCVLRPVHLTPRVFLVLSALLAGAESPRPPGL